MSKRAAIGVALGVVVSVWAGGGMAWAQAQEAALAKPVPAPMPCSRPPIRCGRPASFRTWIYNNLKPDAGNVCRFEERIITPLELRPGEDVDWDFCNECSVDVEVQLDTTGKGPFESFGLFLPVPASNEVKTIVPCHGYGGLSGRNAEGNGSRETWKYSMRARPASAPGPFLDDIDPELVIDDSHGFHKIFGDWGKPIILMVVGLLIGFYVAMKRFKGRMNQ